MIRFLCLNEQPDALEDVTIEPVEDGIDIVNEEPTSDAFAVSTIV